MKNMFSKKFGDDHLACRVKSAVKGMVYATKFTKD